MHNPIYLYSHLCDLGKIIKEWNYIRNKGRWDKGGEYDLKRYGMKIRKSSISKIREAERKIRKNEMERGDGRREISNIS